MVKTITLVAAAEILTERYCDSPDEHRKRVAAAGWGQSKFTKAKTLADAELGAKLKEIFKSRMLQDMQRGVELGLLKPADPIIDKGEVRDFHTPFIHDAINEFFKLRQIEYRIDGVLQQRVENADRDRIIYDRYKALVANGKRGNYKTVAQEHGLSVDRVKQILRDQRERMVPGKASRQTGNGRR